MQSKVPSALTSVLMYKYWQIVYMSSHTPLQNTWKSLRNILVVVLQQTGIGNKMQHKRLVRFWSSSEVHANNVWLNKINSWPSWFGYSNDARTQHGVIKLDLYYIIYGNWFCDEFSLANWFSDGRKWHFWSFNFQKIWHQQSNFKF